jgi:Tfp pilus assembly protein PilO
MYASLKKFILKRLAIIAVVILVGILVINYVLYDMVAASAESQQKLNSEYRAAIEKKEDLDRLSAEYQNIKPRIDTLFSSLLPADDTYKVIDQLEKIAKQTGLEQSIDVSDSVEYQGDLPGIILQVQAKGAKDSLVNYMQLIENLRYYVSVLSVNIETKYSIVEAEEIQEGIDARIKMFVHIAPEN